MANAWVARGQTITIITMTGGERKPFYPLDSEVHLVPLGRSRPSQTPLHAIRNNLNRIRDLRRAIVSSQPDVVISFLDTTNVLTLLATRRLGFPVIVAEHTDPGLKRLHPAWQQLRRVLYPRANRLIVLSESARTYFPARIQQRTVILPNPIAIDPASETIANPDRPQIVGMGRFGPEKGFDQLIDSFALVAPEFPDWDLVIWGEGALRPDLEAQCDRLGLGTRVLLPGQTTRPHDALRTATIFALSSRREGFPMVLAEALACGTPAVAFAISSGVGDILRDQIDGLLVPSGDTTVFAQALASLMTDSNRRTTMAANAPHVLERFGVETIMDRWDALTEDIISSQ